MCCVRHVRPQPAAAREEDAGLFKVDVDVDVAGRKRRCALLNAAV